MNGTSEFFDDRFADGHGLPQTDVSLGGLNNYQFRGISIANGWTSLAFSRYFSTFDKYDVPISTGTMIGRYPRSRASPLPL